MAEYHVLQDRIRHSHKQWHTFVHFTAVLVNGYLLPCPFILCLEYLLELFEFLFLFLIKQLKAPHCKYRLALDRVEHQLDACLGLGQIRDARVVNERLAALRVRGHGPGGHGPQALDDGRFAGTVLPKDQCKRLEKLDFLVVV